MGRLFWKFFFAFWLAQLLTSVGVGIGVWVLRGDGPPMPARALLQPTASQAPSEPAAMHLPMPSRAETGWQPPEPRRGGPLPLRRFWLPMLAGSLVSLLFAAGLAWYFSRPIRSLKQAFDAAADGRLDVRTAQSLASRRDELADLGRDFDRMAGRLQQLVEGQRRLLHDVSHELRSPLARLQAALDLLQQQPERQAEFSARIGREAERMDQLIGELLTLARLDAGAQYRFDEMVDLDELVAGVAEDAAFEGQASGCRVEVQGQCRACLLGNRELLHRALDNVVRNALRHSPAGGQVRLTLALQDQHRAGILVEDEGSGVPEAELEAIFAPFARSTGSHAFAGYGLGLAITRRVMELHGGHIQASNRPQGGLSVSLELPARACGN
jgi:signal transduction histidine kinase